MKALVRICIILITIGLSNPIKLQGQNKAPVRIYLEHFKNQKKHQLSVRVLAKIDKRYRPAPGVEVALFASEISYSTLLSILETDKDGTGTYIFSPEQFASAEKTKITKYFAVVNENDTLQPNQVGITIKEVNFDVRFAIEDSVKQIHAHVSETDSSGNTIQQEGVDIKFLVKRPLSPLPVGGEFNSTDEEGNVYVEFPNDLPGDTEGNVEILVRIDAHEDYGTVEVSEFKQWGIPTYYNDDTIRRTLWASGANAPIPLLIFINVLIVSVWGIIFHIIYKIFWIRKIGKDKSAKIDIQLSNTK